MISPLDSTMVEELGKLNIYISKRRTNLRHSIISNTYVTGAKLDLGFSRISAGNEGDFVS